MEEPMQVEDYTEKPPSTLASLVAGSAAGAAQVISGQPLDTIKLRSQTAPKGQFSSALDIATQTIRNEGFLALYKGMLSPLAGVSLVNAILFASYGSAKKWISPYGPELSLPQIGAAGAIAGAANSIAVSPVELLKIRMQGQYGSASDKKLRAVISELYTQGGVTHGIMRGFWITVLREVPACAAFYTCYEGVKRYFQRSLGKERNLPLWALLTAGGSAGVGYWTACYPLDVVKSRVQLSPRPPRGILYIADTIAQIRREEGWRAFFRGVGPTYLRTIPSAAATFLAYELTIDWLRTTSI